jgi:hypothetical protein
MASLATLAPRGSRFVAAYFVVARGRKACPLPPPQHGGARSVLMASLATLAADAQIRPVRCRSMRRLSGALAGLLLVLAGCGVQSANQPQPGVTPGGSGPETGAVASGANSAASQAPDATAATPGEVAEEQQFTLDDVAEFDDGLMIEVAGTVADKANKTDRGAEATNGQIVIASIRIENKSTKPYDAENVLIAAKYGEDKDAQIIIDKTDDLQSGFKGKIKPKDEGIATVGFAVPWKELKKVTIIVDPNDDVHEAISFSGRVHRE